jgi:hypothetical protein
MRPEPDEGDAVTRIPLARVAALLCLLAPLSLSVPAHAGWDRVGGSIGLDTTNAYFYRGILQEREGIIFQPAVEVTYNFFSADDGALRDVTGSVGGWWSFQSERTGATQDPQWLYEGDYYAGLSFGFDGGISAGATYTFLTSPNDAFSTTQELNLQLAWDDSEAFGAWSMQPWANLTIETNRTAFGPDEGVGLQLGVEPTLYTTEDESFTLTAPAEIGLALHDYYENAGGGENTFGFANVGLAAAIPLTFMPEGYGDWSLGLSAKYYFFSSTLEAANRGRSTYPVGMMSLGVSF